MGLESNRLISTEPHCYEQAGKVQTIEEEGLYTHLKGFDFVRVFRTVDTEGHQRHYMIYKQELQPFDVLTVNRQVFFELKAKHWKIEQTFRAIKQLVHAGHFFVRGTKAIKNHLYCVLRALQKLTLWARDEIIGDIYKLKDHIFLDAQKQFIRNFA